MVLFANTGKEDPRTLDFVHKVDQRWSVGVVWLEYQRRADAHDYEITSYANASRKGEPFDQLLGFLGALPNVQGRSCTAELKIRTMKRYIKSQGLESWTDHIGIRADESHRAIELMCAAPKYITLKFPLLDGNFSKSDVDAFWSQNDFDLRLKDHEGNCDLCFLKARWKIEKIIRERPYRADWWIAAEKQFETKLGGACDGARFRLGRPSYAGLLNQEESQGRFEFATDPAFEQDQDIACSCMEKGTWDDEAA
jgi:3'-phosphoadenosine 5'-phosphosulfate sulfotransferase (PAPS reductase)/FAD synthetase